MLLLWNSINSTRIKEQDIKTLSDTTFLFFSVPVQLTECDINPCQNGASCFLVDNIESYKCHCRTGFKGRHCEGKHNKTSDSWSVLFNSVGLVVLLKFHDHEISRINVWFSWKENRECPFYYNEKLEYKCTIRMLEMQNEKLSFLDASKCYPNPCENLGDCTVVPNGYECSCRRGFRGSRCESKGWFVHYWV